MWKLPATLLRISEPNIRQASDGVDGDTDLKMTKNTHYLLTLLSTNFIQQILKKLVPISQKILRTSTITSCCLMAYLLFILTIIQNTQIH